MQDSLKPTPNYYETLSGSTKDQVDQLIAKMIVYVQNAANMQNVSPQNEKIQFDIAMSQFMHTIREQDLIPRVRNAVREQAYKAWQERPSSVESRGRRIWNSIKAMIGRSDNKNNPSAERSTPEKKLFQGSDDELLVALKSYQLPKMLRLYENGIITFVRALHADEDFNKLLEKWTSELPKINGYAKYTFDSMSIARGGNIFPYEYFKQVTRAAILVAIDSRKDLGS
ncbi:MAG: hypothetical protein WAU07_02440 [Microgenomates group bacterium]